MLIPDDVIRGLSIIGSRRQVHLSILKHRFHFGTAVDRSVLIDKILLVLTHKSYQPSTLSTGSKPAVFLNFILHSNCESASEGSTIARFKDMSFSLVNLTDRRVNSSS